MPDSDRPNLIQNDDLDDLKNQSASYPHTTPAGYPDPQAAAANELLKLRSDIAKLTSRESKRPKISYNVATIYVNDVPVPLTPYKHQALLCEVLLENETTRNRLWEPDEVLELWDRAWKRNYKLRAVADAARRLNTKLAKYIDEPLFLVQGKTVRVNPIYN